jgi:integrase
MKLKKVNDTYHVCFKAEDGSIMQADTKKTDWIEATRTAEQAKAEELERVANITRLTGEIVTKIVSGKNLVLRDALSRYEVWANNNLSRRTAQSHVSYAAKFIKDFVVGNCTPESLTDEAVSKFVNPPSLSIKASTRRVRKAALKSFLDYCYNKGWMTHRPAHLCRVKMDLMTHKQKETKSHLSLKEDEIEYIMRHCNAFWVTAVYLASETGLRLGDICSLEWDSVDPASGLIVVWTDKSDTRVSLNMPTALADTLSNLPVTDTNYVFPMEREIYRDPNRRAWLSSQFKKIVRLAASEMAQDFEDLQKGYDLTKKSFHGLRGYYAKKKAKGGASKEDVAKDLGHSSTETTDIYLDGKS